MLLAVLAVAGIGLLGLHRMNTDTSSLIDHTVADLVATADLGAAVSGTRDLAMRQLATSDPTIADRIGRELDRAAIPRLRESVRTLRLLTADDEESGAELDQIQAGVDRYQRMRGAVDRRAADGAPPAVA